MLKICSACETSVERHLCHKKRYEEYICRECQHAGIKFTWRQRLSNQKWVLAAFFASVGVVSLLTLKFYRIVGSS